MTTFQDLPDMGNGFRLVGSQLMDEEQFLTERWHLDKGEWRCTISGIHEYAKLRAERKEVRHDAWKARQEADDEWSNEVNRTLDGAA